MSTDYQQFGAAEQGMKKNEKIKTICGAFLVGAITSTLIFWGISELVNKDNGSSAACSSGYIVQPTTQQSNALTDIKSVFFNSTWNSSLMTDDDTDKVEDAYNTFDEDGDGTWSYSEFIKFKSFLSNHSSLFYQMDADNDSIVSVREFVAHLLNVHGVSKYILQKRFEYLVYDTYGLDERNLTYKSQTFHEYIADIYYQNFDSYGKGYFNLTDFQYMFYNNSFRKYDEDNDNTVSFEEFIEALFHPKTINNPSGSFTLFRDTMNGVQTYTTENDKTPKKAKLYILKDYDHNDVAALNLTVCPVTEYTGNTAINDAVINNQVTQQRRRRLSCLSSGVSCGLHGVEAGMDCSEAVGQDGLDPVSDVECGSSAIETGSDCYDAYNDCFGSDSSSSTSSGSSYSSYGGGYYGGGYYGY